MVARSLRRFATVTNAAAAGGYSCIRPLDPWPLGSRSFSTGRMSRDRRRCSDRRGLVKPSERVKWLREELARHNDAYFKEDAPLIPTRLRRSRSRAANVGRRAS